MHRIYNFCLVILKLLVKVVLSVGDGHFKAKHTFYSLSSVSLVFRIVIRTVLRWQNCLTLTSLHFSVGVLSGQPVHAD